MKTPCPLLMAACVAGLFYPVAHAAMPTTRIKHILVISVDGMHASDMDHYIQQHPRSPLATLSATGVEYTNAHAAVPADSFPGLLGIMTGGTPAATGVYFDVSYDRQLAASEADCKAGRFGTRVAFDEAADGPADAAGQRQLDPARLPYRAGSCTPVYPHEYLRSNTAFEVIQAAGGHTAWIDKHPVYEILNGPSGHGIDDLYTPEIGGDYEGEKVKPADHITGSISRTENYDAMKAHALLNQIDGWTHDRTHHAAVPTLFGLNLQAVNVAQKLAGYADANGTPTAALAEAMGHCDALLGEMLRELRARHLLDSTLIVVTAKHGNAPIDRTLLRYVDNKILRRTIEAAAPQGLAQLTTDHGALVWLRRADDAPRVEAELRRARQQLGIQQVLQGPALLRFLSVATADSRTPDLLLIPERGVIYGNAGNAKLAEHGGFDDDDTHVALLLSNPHLQHQGKQLSMQVSTTQLAASMLSALGLPPDQLRAVKQQSTKTLPGISWHSL
ncbi:MAG: alkaline phosphatase family protein [Rhodanobacter sp.]